MVGYERENLSERPDKTEPHIGRWRPFRKVLSFILMTRGDVLQYVSRKIFGPGGQFFCPKRVNAGQIANLPRRAVGWALARLLRNTLKSWAKAA